MSCYPSENIQKRLRAQYVSDERMELEAMLESIPMFMMIIDTEHTFPSYNFRISKPGPRTYRVSYVNDQGEEWCHVVGHPFVDAVGEFLAYLLEYDKGDVWFRDPGHPDYKRGEKKGA